MIFKIFHLVVIYCNVNVFSFYPHILIKILEYAIKETDLLTTDVLTNECRFTGELTGLHILTIFINDNSNAGICVSPIGVPEHD